MRVACVAPAKINLYLHVAEPRADTYHPLDSLVVFARDAADVVTATTAEDYSLMIGGPFAGGLSQGTDNLVFRAARALADAGGASLGAAIHLEKNLPLTSGIGGGSADAAATLRVLNVLWRLGATSADLEAIAVRIGADVPVCVRSQTARMRGIGEDLSAVHAAVLGAVLVNPGVASETAGVFRSLDALGAFGPLEPSSPIPREAGALLDWLGKQRNDLEAPAMAQTPAIAETLRVLREAAPTALVRMSGSGATCVVLPRDGQHAVLADTIAQQRPDWWVCATTLGNADATVQEAEIAV